jgi:hypothetical protein
MPLNIRPYCLETEMDWLKNIDAIQIITTLIPIGISLSDHLFPGWIKLRRMLAAVAVLSLLAFAYYTYFREPHVNELLFILFLFLWGGAVYSVIVELLRLGLGVYLSGQQRSNKWIRRLEYPCLLFSILGVVVTINRLPIMTQTIPVIDHLDLIGPVILMTAATIKFAKTRAEIGDWHTLTSDQWKSIW